MTSSSGISGVSSTIFKTQGGDMNNISSASDRNQDLMRLKKEYHTMVRKELTKMKKDKEYHTGSTQKSPDRDAPFYSHSHTNSFVAKSPYMHNSSINNTTLSGNDY